MKRKLTPIVILLCLLLAVQPVFADSVELSEDPVISAEQSAQEKTVTSGQTSGTASNTAVSGAAVADGSKAAAEIPEIASEAAVLYDATAKQVLYSKNPDKQMYPASITKIMTVLLAAEKLSLSDVITFKASATENLESGYTNVSMTTGDTMSVKDAMYAILLKSACEVSNGVAEKVSGTQSAFADLMNKRAKELGCKNTNFRNASGLNDSKHLTTAYDMALIAAAAFNNQTFRTVASTKSYTLPASKKRGSLKLTNSNKMLYSTNAEYVEGIVGGKTGYTSKAGNTLVENADIGGHQLVAVVMKSSGKQYTDSQKLLEYGRKLLTGAASSEGKTSVNGQSSTSAAQTDTAAASSNSGAWEQTSNGRKYKKTNGNYAAGEWLKIDGEEYYFGSDGIAATGWKQFKNGAWYFFDQTTGAMIHNKWVSTDGVKYYYLQENGEMAKNTVIDGSWRVDENGVYVEKVG